MVKVLWWCLEGSQWLGKEGEEGEEEEQKSQEGKNKQNKNTQKIAQNLTH